MNFARTEASRVDQELDAAGNEALRVGERTAGQYGGEKDERPKQREAARQVARESREDIVSKKGSIRPELMAKAQEAVAKYDEYRITVHQEIDGVEQHITPQVDDAERASNEAFHEAARHASQQIDQEMTARSRSLDEIEQRSAEKLRADGARAKNEITQQARQQTSRLDEMAKAIGTHIDHAVTEAEQHVASLEAPFLPGVLDLVQSVRAQVTELGQGGTTQVTEAGRQAATALKEMGQGFQQNAAKAIESVTGTSERIRGEGEAGLNRAETAYVSAAQASLSQLQEQQDSAIDQSLAQLDRWIDQAKNRVEQSNEKVKADITKAANQSLVEAKKPLTDPLPDRCRAAAEKAAEPAWMGVVRALGALVVGFVILVAAAALAVVVAAAFSVSLTFMGAMLIVGAIALVVGAAYSAYQRRQAGDSWLGAIGKGLVDATGFTGLYQAIRNRDLFTGEALNWGASERWEQGIIGGVSLIALFGGIRGAFRGPLVRNTGLSAGWRGWRTALFNIRRDTNFFRIDLATWTRNLYLRLRYGRTQVEQPAEPLRSRAGLRQGTRDAVWDNAPRDANGQPIDPNTGQPIPPGNENFGHRYGQEWAKFRRDPANQGMTRQEVLDAQNEPGRYQLEGSQSNQGHTWEQNPATLHGYPVVPDPHLHADQNNCPQ